MFNDFDLTTSKYNAGTINCNNNTGENRESIKGGRGGGRKIDEKTIALFDVKVLITRYISIF